MIEIQLTLEALGVFNSPKCQKAAIVGSPAKVSQLRKKGVNSSVRGTASSSSFPDRTVHATHHFPFAIWTTVMELLLYCPWRGHMRSLRLALQFPWTRGISGSGPLLSPRTEGWQKIYNHSVGLKVVGGPIGNTRRNGLSWSCSSSQVRKLNASTSPWKQSSISWSISKACLLQCRSHCRIKAVRRSDRNIRNKNLKEQYSILAAAGD